MKFKILSHFNWACLKGLNSVPFLTTALAFTLISCAEEPKIENPLYTILESDNPAIATVMSTPDAFEVQIRYSRILRQGDSVYWNDYDFKLNPDHYFYPASTVKFPTAVLALEKLNYLDSLSQSTKYSIEGDTLENTFEQDIINIFAVSDNHANNRLLEFLGQDAINDSIQAKQAGPVRIAHRLGVHDDDVTTKPIIWYLNDSVPVQSTPIVNRPAIPLSLLGIHKGVGYVDGDSLIKKPFDFSLKNYLPISTLDGILKRVIFPQNFPSDQRFHISETQREFLLNAMQITPREAGFDPNTFPDGYCKFFMFGDVAEAIPEDLQIFNKVGFAYGTLTDCAYVFDARNGVEFMLSATILANENKIFNDDRYEYDTNGIPFLAALGRAVYNFESQSRGSSIRLP